MQHEQESDIDTDPRAEERIPYSLSSIGASPLAYEPVEYAPASALMTADDVRVSDR